MRPKFNPNILTIHFTLRITHAKSRKPPLDICFLTAYTLSCIILPLNTTASRIDHQLIGISEYDKHTPAAILWLKRTHKVGVFTILCRRGCLWDDPLEEVY